MRRDSKRNRQPTHDRLILERKGEFRRHGTWVSAYVKPSGRVRKRQAAKRFRQHHNVPSGSAYKKLWGWFEWS